MLDVKFFEFGGKRVLRYLVAGRGARRCDKLIPRRFWAVTLRGAPMSLELEIWKLLYQEEVPQVDVLCPDIYVIWFISCWFEIPPFPTASRKRREPLL